MSYSTTCVMPPVVQYVQRSILQSLEHVLIKCAPCMPLPQLFALSLTATLQLGPWYGYATLLAICLPFYFAHWEECVSSPPFFTHIQCIPHTATTRSHNGPHDLYLGYVHDQV